MTASILWKLHDYTPQFTENESDTLLEIWGRCWLKYEKIKKLRKIWRKPYLKLKQVNYINYRNKKTHEITNRLCSGLGIILKTNDEIYVSISIGKHIIAFRLFSVLCQRRYWCWKYRKRGSHLKNCYHYVKVVENARINSSITLYCTLLFSRKENF